MIISVSAFNVERTGMTLSGASGLSSGSRNVMMTVRHQTGLQQIQKFVSLSTFFYFYGRFWLLDIDKNVTKGGWWYKTLPIYFRYDFPFLLDVFPWFNNMFYWIVLKLTYLGNKINWNNQVIILPKLLSYLHRWNLIFSFSQLFYPNCGFL